MPSTSYERAYALMERVVKQCHRPEPDETVLKAVDCVSKALTGMAGEAAEAGEVLGEIGGILSTVRALAKAGDLNLLPNPHFVQNGLGGNIPSGACEAFQRREGFARFGTELAMLVGDATHVATAGINTTSVAVHGSATATSCIHVARILAYASSKKFDHCTTLQDWCHFLVKMKTLRAAVHGVGLAGAVIPGASLPAKIATTVAAMGIKMTLTSACYTVAAAIHWRAYREMTLARMGFRTSAGHRAGVHGKPVGPASTLFWEVMTRRGFSRFWQDDIENIILEPAGWRVLGAKLIQM